MQPAIGFCCLSGGFEPLSQAGILGAKLVSQQLAQFLVFRF
jgi:hypothetical protein